MLYIYNNMYYNYNMKSKSRKLYNRIAVLRKEKNISRKELAEEIGVCFQTIGYLEREEYNPSLDLAFKISEYFDLPIEIVFSTRKLQPLSQQIKDLEGRRK